MDVACNAELTQEQPQIIMGRDGQLTSKLPQKLSMVDMMRKYSLALEQLSVAEGYEQVQLHDLAKLVRSKIDDQAVFAHTQRSMMLETS